jgi:hypothetical protein
MNRAKQIAKNLKAQREGGTGWAMARIEELRPCLAWSVWSRVSYVIPVKDKG